MYLLCPHCDAPLRLRVPSTEQLARCPACGQTFRPLYKEGEANPKPPASIPTRQIFVALDVSTSMSRYLGDMHSSFLHSLHEIRRSGPFEVALYLFNQSVLPFPTAQQCRPTPFEEAKLPSVGDLRQRLAGGTAILDALDHLIEQSLGHEGADRRVILLTDGWERSSKTTTVDELRRKIRSHSSIQVSMNGFGSRSTKELLLSLVRGLELPPDCWSIEEHHNDDASISGSIHALSSSIIDQGSRASRF